MTFEERQKEILFDAFHDVSKGNLTHWTEMSSVLEWASVRITQLKAHDLFKEYKEIGYVEVNEDGKYRLSDAGKMYYEYLKKESTKYEADIKAIISSTKTGVWTRRNMIISGVLALITSTVVVKGCFDNKEQNMQQRNKDYKESIQQLQIHQDVQELTKELHQISLILSDTSRVRGKTEK